MKKNEMAGLNKKAGYNFFDKETMKFWGSCVETDSDKNGYFVTSEDNFDKSKKLYSIRQINQNGKVESIAFQKYETKAEAIIAKKELSKREEN